MGYATLKMSGREYVLVPKSEFKRLTLEDQRDARKATRAAAEFRSGKLRMISHAALKRSLGL